MQKLKQGDTFTLTEDLPKEKLFTNDVLKLVYKGPVSYGPGDFDESIEKFTFLTSYGREWVILCHPDEKKLEKLTKAKEKLKQEIRLPLIDEEYTFDDYLNTGFSEVFNGDAFIAKKYIFNRDNFIIEAIISRKKVKLDFDKEVLRTKEGLHLSRLLERLRN